jgi:hypothetical protein
LQLLLALVAVVAVALVGAAPASAQYEPGQPGFVLDPPVVEPGGAVGVIGTGCPPGSLVEVSIEGAVVGTTTALDDGIGSFLTSITAPGTVGQYVVTVVCEGVTMTQVLTVVATACGFDVTGAPGAPATATVPGLEIGSAYTLLFEIAGSGAVDVGAGTATSDPQTVSFSIPATTPAGLHNLAIVGTSAAGGDVIVDCAVNVTGGVASGALPRTGAEAAGLARWGAALVGLGGLVLLTVRRRTARA